MNNKFYIGIYNNNDFKVNNNRFITSEDYSCGQFISSNWLKIKIENNKLKLVLIKSKLNPNSILPGELKNITSIDRIIEMIGNINTEIVDIYEIDKVHFEDEIKSVDRDFRITFDGIFDNSEYQMSLAISKNKYNEYFICNPCYHKK